ncbi:hypothetical protein [uncultured Arthrobacter sp.]|uniref:hypothetical protein n=1 Tax=uncultured Arthrobacter sp. TaxID=114050 RepID=UPI0028D02CF6|nr:hypothetical protein [uncultured Arthrobacter sp.]
MLQDFNEDAGEDVGQALIEDYLLTLVARAARILKTFTRGDLELSVHIRDVIREGSRHGHLPPKSRSSDS